MKTPKSKVNRPQPKGKTPPSKALPTPPARAARNAAWQKGLLRWLPLVLCLLSALFAWWLLVEENSDFLYAAQGHNLWLPDASYWHDKAAFIGGAAQWAGCYLTQFFYHPWMGAVLLILLWTVIYVVSVLAYGLRGLRQLLALLPLFALLLSEVDLGYWLFYMKSPGYWFVPSLSLLALLLSLWLCRWQRGWVRLGAMVVLCAVLYPLTGWWALAIPLWTTLEALAGRDARRWYILAAAAVLLIAVPLVYYNVYDRQRIGAAWIAALPVFETESARSYHLSLPFVLCALMPALYTLAGRRPHTSPQRGWHTVLRAVGAVVWVALLMWGTDRLSYRNYNFSAEQRIFRAIEENRFQDVLSELRQAPGPYTRQMVLGKNIALMHTGGIGDKFFTYDNSGEPPYVRDSLRVHIAQVCGAQTYYQYGKCNFACRWSIENGVEYGFNVDQLKMLVRCAMMSGERRVAQKYLDMLLNTTFQREWAQQWITYLNDPQAYYRSDDYRLIAPLRVFDNTIDGDEGLVEMYIINYFSHMHKPDPKFQEQTLVYALVQKDIQLFWPRFFTYAGLPAHATEPMPIHYQEAAYLYGRLETDVDISKMPFDKERIINRYEKFLVATNDLLRTGMNTDQMGLVLKPAYGDTFWWFYYFCRNVHTY